MPAYGSGPSKSGANDIPLGPRRKLGTTSLAVKGAPDVKPSPRSSHRDSGRESHGSSRSSRRSRSRSPQRRSRFDMRPGRSQLAIEPAKGAISTYPDAPDYMKQMAIPSNDPTANIKRETQAYNTIPDREGKPKGRRSRWSGVTEKAVVPGMPTMIPQDVSEDALKQYLVQLEIEDCSRRLRLPDLGLGEIAIHDRSPSPEPTYDSRGKRMNTREYRTRQMLEMKRHKGIIAMQTINPGYKPPMDYKLPNVKMSERVFIPAEEYPDINFVGLLIGPRGNTLKALEKDTGCRIIVRGKGSTKESKIARPDAAPKEGADEPLHAFVTGTDFPGIHAACEKVQALIQEAIEAPENYLEMRKIQLRELAVLNGTLRPEDVLGTGKCDNCGEIEHRTWECPNAQNVTQSVICTACGSYGHLARDCIQPTGMAMGGGSQPAGIDDEYTALMAELGEGAPPGVLAEAAAKAGAGGGNNPRFGQQQPGGPSFDPNSRYGGRGPPRGNGYDEAGYQQQPVMRVNLAQTLQQGYNPQQSYGGGGGQNQSQPWAPPPGGWSMPPGMGQQQQPQQGYGYSQGGYGYAQGGMSVNTVGAAPPPPPPIDVSQLLAAPAPPPPEE